MKCALAIVALLAITAGAQGRHLAQAPSGGSNNTVVRWLVPQNGILDAVRVPVNGTVTFSWTSLHDLWEIPSAQCPTTFTNGSGITQIARQATGGTATLTFPQERVRYFSCSVSNHCSQGQLIAIRVGNARAGAPVPGPAQSSSGYSGNSSPGYAGGSSSNYGSSGNSSSSGYSGNSSPGYAGGSSSNYGSSSSSSSGYSGNSSPGYAGGSSSNYGSGSGR